ncbi:hypothetical protein AB0H71_25805 [Nocardia sp. NPDC050697]|uniref:hypothetical protein n=1 Tax=Nocardia sp. NPDC050697 TaxID=3155158 RepID=UPI0033E71E40
MRAQQMTDPYLWAKLKQDAANDPEFKQWLIDNNAWDAVEKEDSARVGYRLAKTDTDGNIVFYGSTQEPANGWDADDTIIGKTTGNAPDTPEAERNPGPTVFGIAQPITTGGPLAWAEDLARNGMSAPPALAWLAPLPFQPPANPAARRRGRDNRSLTITITPRAVPIDVVSQAEALRCLTYRDAEAIRRVWESTAGSPPAPFRRTRRLHRRARRY